MTEIIQGGSLIESLPAIPFLKQPEGRIIVFDPANDASFSLQDAIDECVAGQGDIIVFKPGGTTVTATVNFNKSGIRVMATGPTRNPLVTGEYHAILANASFTDGPVAKVTKPCVIDGIGFAGRDTGALFFAGAALLLGGDSDANPFGVQLLRCRFPKWGLDNRIGVAIEGSSDCLIDECIFEGGGADFDAGIYIQGAMQNLIVRKNYFRQCTAAIKTGAFAGGGPHVFIHENFVEDGKLLDSDGNSGNGLIAGNYLETATNTASYDRSVADMKSAGWQFSGNHYSE